MYMGGIDIARSGNEAVKGHKGHTVYDYRYMAILHNFNINLSKNSTLKPEHFWKSLKIKLIFKKILQIIPILPSWVKINTTAMINSRRYLKTIAKRLTVLTTIQKFEIKSFHFISIFYCIKQTFKLYHKSQRYFYYILTCTHKSKFKHTFQTNHSFLIQTSILLCSHFRVSQSVERSPNQMPKTRRHRMPKLSLKLRFIGGRVGVHWEVIKHLCQWVNESLSKW